MIAAIDEALESARFGRLLTFAVIVAWVAAVDLVCQQVGAAMNEQLFSTSLYATVGGCGFGIGAAFNGACSFGTLGRLAGGDISFLATIAGIAIGFALEHGTVSISASYAFSPPFAAKAASMFVAAAVLLASAAFDARSSGSGWRRAPRWAPARTAAAIGIAGGILYVLHDHWSYSLLIGRLVDGSVGVATNDTAILVVVAAIVAGAITGAAAEKCLSVRLRRSLWPRRLSGGILMGYGAAVIPGGNDILILHGMPELSPQAFAAFAGMLLSATTMLAIFRSFPVLRSWSQRGL